MNRSPRFDVAGGKAWKARPYVELHATGDKDLYDFERDLGPGYWPVYSGESFDIWTPDTGKRYAVGKARLVTEHLQTKRLSSARQARSVFSEFPIEYVRNPETLACRSPRIAFRDVTRATDSRTVRAALVPPEVLLTHKAPYLLWPRGTPDDEAFLLGVLCSLPFDWYARRFVEVTLSYELLNGFPVPGAADKKSLRTRTIDCAVRLAAPDARYTIWARSFKHKPKQLVDDEKDDLIAELDAAVAHLYGLSEADLVHIFETFHHGWNNEARLTAAIRHYSQLKGLA